jgi:hypothetical protein
MGMSANHQEGTHATVQLDAEAVERAVMDAVAAQYPQYRGWFKSEVYWTRREGTPIPDATVELFIVNDPAPREGREKGS